MEQKRVLGIFALSMVALLGIGMVSAFGFGNGISDEDREALENAIESGDYEAWREIKMSQISEERFNEIQARHQERAEFRTAMQEARASGDYSRIQELKEEFGEGRKMHKRNMNFGECPFAK
jgi:hypothetical protein